jgi:nitroreductase
MMLGIARRGAIVSGSADDPLGSGPGDQLLANSGIFCFHPDGLAVTDANLPRVSVIGGGSIYSAVQNLLLACRAEGFGCVLSTLLCKAEPEVREILRIPQPWWTAAAVPIGYPQLRGHGPISRRPVEQMAFLDSWDQPFT